MALVETRDELIPVEVWETVHGAIARNGTHDALRAMLVDYYRKQSDNDTVHVTIVRRFSEGGQMVALRENRDVNYFAPGYFEGIVVNATLPLNQIMADRVNIVFSYSEIDQARDGGTRTIPRHDSPMDEEFRDGLLQLAKLSVSESREAPPLFGLGQLYGRVGVIDIPSPDRRLQGEDITFNGSESYDIGFFIR